MRQNVHNDVSKDPIISARAEIRHIITPLEITSSELATVSKRKLFLLTKVNQTNKFEIVYSQLSPNGLLYKTDTFCWFRPFFSHFTVT